ncbi:MAG TPA: threonine synthase [Bacteroidales bacterium]|nr:threonine synthase [Bacteroidales bacterium]HSA44154.1 threonine synthase [Bacteroidales bacterium]
MSLLYYSTNLESPAVNFPEALLRGQAPDRGLYMPVIIPPVETGQMEHFRNMSYAQIASEVTWKYLEGQIPREILDALTRDAYGFDVPLEHVTDRKYVMRLDQGPTASFKDFAARLMGRLMNYYLSLQNRKLLILTATSGDTGSAVSHAFLGLDNIRVVVLFPEKEVSRRQRKQMTTLGHNITVISMDGKFDDCQALVKQAFADPVLEGLSLSSANSINIGRLVPQTVYYFYAWSRLSKPGEKMIFSVPSGNFGDMMGGVMAMKMGLPVERFIIAVNGNDEFPRYLESGVYEKIEPSRNCISSAMNVGHPSNLARLAALYRGVMDEKGNIRYQADLQTMRKELWSVSVSDQQTRDTIKSAWDSHRLLLEPHGAVGWAGLQEFLEYHPDLSAGQLCVSLETAHPAKFPEEINSLLGFNPELPPSLQGLEEKEEHCGNLPTDYPAFRDFLLENYS